MPIEICYFRSIKIWSEAIITPLSECVWETVTGPHYQLVESFHHHIVRLFPHISFVFVKWLPWFSGVSSGVFMSLCADGEGRHKSRVPFWTKDIAHPEVTPAILGFHLRGWGVYSGAAAVFSQQTQQNYANGHSIAVFNWLIDSPFLSFRREKCRLTVSPFHPRVSVCPRPLPVLSE